MSNKKADLRYLSYFTRGDYKFVKQNKYVYYKCQACSASDATHHNSGRFWVDGSAVSCYQPRCKFNHNYKTGKSWFPAWEYIDSVEGSRTGRKLGRDGVNLMLDVLKSSSDYRALESKYESRNRTKLVNIKPWIPEHAIPLTTYVNDYTEKAWDYVKGRGFMPEYLYKYFSVMYAVSGPYAGYLIIPFTDVRGRFRYFQARDYLDRGKMFRWNNPPEDSFGVSKTEMFYNEFILTDPNLFQLFLVEGVFDNYEFHLGGYPCVTIMGTYISDTHILKLKSSSVKTIYLCLDEGTYLKSLIIAEKLIKNGFKVMFVEVLGGDINELGYEAVDPLVENAIEVTKSNLTELRRCAVDENGAYTQAYSGKTFKGQKRKIISFK